MENTQFAKNAVGQRYYTYNEQNELKTVRVKAVYKGNKVAVYDESLGLDHSFILTKEEIKKSYSKIRSDMSFTFGTVFSLKSGSRDVMVTMFRQGEHVPYLVCRQMMVMNYDEYEANVNSKVPTAYKPILGTVLINVEGTDGLLENMLRVSMGNNCSIEGYFDDNEETIMKLIPRKIFKECNDFLNNTYYKLKDKYEGLEPTIHKLLEVNYFWEDVDNTFNIYRVPFIMREQMYYDEEQLKVLELITSHKMSEIETIRYAKDVDLTKLKTDYILVRDKYGVLYLVVYIKGEFNVALLDKEGILSEEEVAKLMPSKK